MKVHRLGWLGALLTLYGCQVIAGLEERSARSQEAEAGSGGDGGGGAAGSQAGAGGAGAGGAGAAGAGGSAGAAGAGAAGVSGGGQAGQALARPPARVGTPKLSGKQTTPKVFIVKSILFGNRKQPNDKKPDNNAWKTIGFDFDGKCTTPEDQSGVCTKIPNSYLDVIAPEGYFDGDGCRDNAFGGRLFKAIGVLQTNFDQELNQSIEYKGAQTLMIEIEDLDEGPDDPLAPASVYLAAHVNDTPPDWFGDNARILDKSSLEFSDAQGNPVEVSSVPNGALAPGLKYKAKYRYEQGYVANNVWVSGPFEPEKGPVPHKNILPLGGLKLDVDLLLSALTLTFGEPSHETVVESQFGAIVSTDSLKVQLPVLLDTIFPKECGGGLQLPGTDLASLVASASDLMPTAPFSGDPSASCNAIGLGLGLIWAPGAISKPPGSELGPYVADSIPIDPCAGKAGAGGSGGDAGSAGASGQGGSGGGSD